MQTIHWKINEQQSNQPIYQEAAELLQNGECVAFPTETVYGLGADATNQAAIQKIYAAKGRPSDNPLIVHIARREQMDQFVASYPPKAVQLMEKFWPGPLTVILPLKEDSLAANVSAGLSTVGVRMPEHPVSLELIKVANIPVAAPSANRSGKPSPTTANHVIEDLDGKIAGIIDGGPTGVGLESTVIDCSLEVPIILRPGGITKEQIERVIGSVDSSTNSANETEKPKAPGMKYTHYAPKAPVYLIDGSTNFWQSEINKAEAAHKKLGILATKELTSELTTTAVIQTTGSIDALDEIATSLYNGLRAFDHADVDIIFAEVYPETELGAAIMNRLEKAAGNRRISE
ncbi:L-threonylcarbamoyladenylate synthase [Listeria swaminathanii]|uniref:Threonylcarbamoyl-AMP synthase n=1 Tax=Listeria swaminathanii TaxID=2713501 RepID=A0ABU2II29_9LIST|nr:L-threonylcarbamoyladenylate synthase [Listeria swaminathanii]MDT0017859.1 L-threonylcarbamoyladenylate synthase [Listeria swaminathanii]MDT0023486.1 L-threonylcarbamoyladenylate synthase [Listeria swaminathanii]MDT0034522.1 L-threonylcarbamoyladenylate synthase [Listeria swaminathanii]MDT0053250.1 L-threonylcarbamoyladenylate synthase [Listeria swaminathanii]MDT0056016.1 L-threonylcarbamoyladenylate synthase [Listeria swaminathanii]